MRKVVALKWVPPFAQGLVRDLRIRWALEEAGLPYEVTLVDGSVTASESYRHWQPFGQVPAYRDDGVEMFESGAIVLHIAGKSEALAPPDEAAGWLRADPLTLPPGVDQGTLRVVSTADAGLIGLWMLKLTATALEDGRWPVVSQADVAVEFVER